MYRIKHTGPPQAGTLGNFHSNTIDPLGAAIDVAGPAVSAGLGAGALFLNT